MSTTELVNPLHPSIEPLLDPEFVTYYNANIATKPPTHKVPLADVRADPAKYAGPWVKDFSGTPGVKDVQIPSKDGHMIALRIYSPDATAFGNGPYPVHVNFHGGGFVFGDLTADGNFCDMLRRRLGMVVVDVDYRLCPEHCFGKNIEDGWAAVSWVHQHADEMNVFSSSISLGGISAGGHLAAVMQHVARDAGLPLKLAILSVPTTDYSTYWPVSQEKLLPSVLRMENTAMLPRERLVFFRNHVNNEKHRDYIEKNVPVSWRTPLHSPNFKDLCDTFVITAECDPLVDEGEAYAKKVLEAGGKVLSRRFLGMPHPFMHMSVLTKAKLYDDDVCAALSMAHGL